MGVPTTVEKTYYAQVIAQSPASQSQFATLADANMNQINIQTYWNGTVKVGQPLILSTTLSLEHPSVPEEGVKDASATFHYLTQPKQNAVALGQQYQPTYTRAFFTARLQGITLEIKPSNEQPQQSLNQQTIEFDWKVMPDTVGVQRANILISAVWSTPDGTHSVKHQLVSETITLVVNKPAPAVSSGKDFWIDIVQHFFTQNGFLLGILLCSAGLVFVTPWCLLRFRRVEQLE